MDLGLNSWDFYLGFDYMKFQITNSSVVELFLDEFHVGFQKWL